MEQLTSNKSCLKNDIDVIETAKLKCNHFTCDCLFAGCCFFKHLERNQISAFSDKDLINVAPANLRDIYTSSNQIKFFITIC